MDTKDFRARKRGLERDIEQAINILLADFEQETGYTPSAININLVCKNSLGQCPPWDYMLESVTTEITL